MGSKINDAGRRLRRNCYHWVGPFSVRVRTYQSTLFGQRPGVTQPILNYTSQPRSLRQKRKELEREFHHIIIAWERVYRHSAASRRPVCGGFPSPSPWQRLTHTPRLTRRIWRRIQCHSTIFDKVLACVLSHEKKTKKTHQTLTLHFPPPLALNRPDYLNQILVYMLLIG